MMLNFRLRKMCKKIHAKYVDLRSNLAKEGFMEKDGLRYSNQGTGMALQSECEASSALLGEMHAQQAEFSHAKSQEFEALQAQPVSLNGDLAKQLELIDCKVEEADTLKEKFKASQLELERFSAEYCV
ncbi:hypothetical protein HPB47_016512 [Ixodes persulcatus]|uniref:Uncharacterized protein n=1 Tax=Ixodes persulcatus TaxID=34615 RepID=A0AC60QSS4_IXOPE|nr:hypothetical protein HPB47_016512 [Ixodes persulcatus]